MLICTVFSKLILEAVAEREREYLRELREKQQKQSRFNSKYEISKDEKASYIF